MAAVKALLHQNRAREALRQRAQQLAHGVRTADAGEHQQCAAEQADVDGVQDVQSLPPRSRPV